MSRESVTYRLGVSGDQEIRATLAAIGESGDSSAKRIARSFERDMRTVEATADRAKRRFEALQALGGSAVQRRIAESTGLAQSEFGNTKSAEASMGAFIRQQDALARSRERLIAQADPLFAAQQRYNATMAEAMRLDRAGALAKGDLAKVQARAQAQLEGMAGSQNTLLRTSGAMTSGIQQAGFQVSDFAVQVGGGTSAIRAASQQAPQLVQAMALMGMGAENTTSKFGKFTAFLAGPWGAAITVGVSVLGVLASKYIDTGRASEEAEETQYDFAKAIDFSRLSVEEMSAAMDQLVKDTEAAIRVQGDFANMKLGNAEAAASEIDRDIATKQTEIREARRKRNNSVLGGVNWAWYNNLLGNLQDELGELRKAREGAEEALVNAQIGVARAQVEEASDPAAKARGEFARAVSELDERFKLTKSDPLIAGQRGVYIDEAGYKREYERLDKLKDKAIEDAREIERERRKLERGGDGQSGLTQFESPIVGGRPGAPFGQRRGNRTHGGVDIPTAVGTPVLATADGVVEFAGERGAYGNLLTIKIDDRTESRDAHLSRFAVEVGDIVKKGQVIGYTGGARGAPGAGNSTGPHLHHELRIDGKAVNPFGKYAIDDRYADAQSQILDRAKEEARQQAQNEQAVRRLMEAADPFLVIANKLKDDLAEIDRLAALAPDAGGIGSEQADILRGQAQQRARKAELETKLGGIAPQLDYATKFLDEADEKDADYAKRLAGAKADQAEALAYLELEAKLLGASVQERSVAIEQFEYIADLKRQGLDLNDEEVKKLIEGNAEWFRRRGLIDDANETLERQREIGEQVIDTLLDPSGWDDWGEMGKRVINMLIQELMLLAVINPLKNSLYGTDHPTIGQNASGIFGFLGGIFGGGKAGGSEYTQDGFFEVGEFGKELVRLPRGSQVVNGNRTRAMERSGGRAQTLNFDLRGAVVTEDLLRQMQAMADRAAEDGAARGANKGVEQMIDLNKRTFGAALSPV